MLILDGCLFWKSVKINTDVASKNTSQAGCDGLTRGTVREGYMVSQNLLEFVGLT